MHIIPCEACGGTGLIEYTSGQRFRDCKICRGSGELEITDEEYARLQELK